MGPSDHAMWLLGDKVASSIVAQTAAVPTLPWSGSNLLVGLDTLSFFSTIPQIADYSFLFCTPVSLSRFPTLQYRIVSCIYHLWSLRILLLTALGYFISVVKYIYQTSILILNLWTAFCDAVSAISKLTHIKFFYYYYRLKRRRMER
jgi:hypothetical protein